MLEALVTATIVEIVVFLVVLVLYLVAVMRNLRKIAERLARVSMGVRAIETELGRAGPAVERLNHRLAGVTAGMGDLRGRAAR